MPLVQCPDCRSKISAHAPACPHCGRPTPPTAMHHDKPVTPRSPFAIGCLVLVVIVAIVGMIAGNSGSSHSSEPDAPSPATAATDDLRRRSTAKLLAMKEWPEQAAIARLCEEAELSQLNAAIKERCADAHAAAAAKSLKDGNATAARQALGFAAAEGISSQRRERIEAPLKRAEAAAEKKRRAAEATAGIVLREAYAKALRQRYLDSNLDIDVRVSGSKRDRITLEFALFNAVWANKVQQGELLDEMRKLGFTRVDMTDNYDYHVRWDLK
jgi:hypothetical protein